METIVLKDNEILKDEIYSNLEFDTLIKVEGDNVLIENIIVNAPKKDFHRIIRVCGKNCHIKNCRFSDISVNGPVIVVEHRDETPDNCIIEGCLFYGGLKTDKDNGLEGIRLGESKTSLMGEGGNIIYNNRFEKWDREIEAISVKNSGNLIINNEMVNCASTFTLRHGKDNMVAYNFIDGKDKKESGGIRVCDDNHTIIGNVLFNINGDGLRCAISLMCGVKDSPLNRYLPIHRCFLIYNTLFNCKNGIALGMKKKEAIIKPNEVYIQSNNFISCKNNVSLNKDNIGCEKTIQGLNYEDKNEVEKFKYPNKPEEFKVDDIIGTKKAIVDYTNKQMILRKKEMEKLEKLETITEEPEKKYDEEMINKIVNKINISMRMKQIEDIQKKMEENLLEHKKLIDEIRNIMI
jgi:hypothetical protein